MNFEREVAGIESRTQRLKAVIEAEIQKREKALDAVTMTVARHNEAIATLKGYLDRIAVVSEKLGKP